jgi:hypothetical protein
MSYGKIHISVCRTDILLEINFKTMAKYILNRNKQDSPNGENYEVHNEENCVRLPLQDNRINLGYFYNCKDAMTAAISKFSKSKSDIDGCFWCCNFCHKE